MRLRLAADLPQTTGTIKHKPKRSHRLGTEEEIRAQLIALARREREELLTADEVTAALLAARVLAESWHEIVPSDAVRRTAARLLRTHPLRVADSLQLAAALVAANHDPTSLAMVCMDEHLRLAARREGFGVLGL